jgi:hypothetical protein
MKDVDPRNKSGDDGKGNVPSCTRSRIGFAVREAYTPQYPRCLSTTFSNGSPAS